MRERQTNLQEPQHELTQDVSTPWNSTNIVLQRLYEQRRVISDIMLNPRVAMKNGMALLSQDTEWEIIRDLSTVFSDLMEVTTYMCAE